MNILLFGATGSAGAAVLDGSLRADIVTEVRAVARRPLDRMHPKLRAIRHDDYLDYAPIADAFAGIDACFFCLGISSTQVDEAEYRKITHDYAIAAARMLRERSPGGVFHYISGAGSNEKGRSMWSRVKGATERELIEGFDAVCWRPAAIDAELSPRAPGYYKLIRPFVKLFSPFPALYITGEDLGKAMIQATVEGMRARIIENREMRELAKRA